VLLRSIAVDLEAISGPVVLGAGERVSGFHSGIAPQPPERSLRCRQAYDQERT
jgi:hypothetical protein